MNEHKMFEIDPKLFVTCRLCLNNMGTYQIVPSVQKQIKFCYDIEAHPFDSLPQLICRDCEAILSTYYKVKTDYLEKQKKLRKKVEKKSETLHSSAKPDEDDIVTSSQEVCSEGNNKNNRKRRISSHNSSEASDENCSVKSEGKTQSNCESSPSGKADVEVCYKKWFICSFCNYQCKSKYKIIRHINTHSSMKQKYINLIKHDCYVKLDKIDNTPNYCKSEKNVVLSSDKITHSVHNFYYVIIRPKKNSSNKSDRDSSSETDHIMKSENSDEDTFPIAATNRRRINRILSNDTVVIGNGDLDSSMFDDGGASHATAKPNDSEIKDNECISIDDSESESCKSGDVLINRGTNLTSPVDNGESKTIRDIISFCFKRHSKRQESNDTIEANMSRHAVENHLVKIDSSLKHKALSVGQKLITNSTCNCTGILRYLEHQNLEIMWIPKIQKPLNKKPDCVRIKMKLMNHEENDSDSGWKVLHSNKVNKQPTYISDSLNEKELIPKTHNAVNERSENNNIGDKDSSKEISTEGGMALSHAIKQNKDNTLKKLLNENPVANPKTLAKKPPIKKKKKNKRKDKPVTVDMPIIETAEAMVMPIITSTVSLAAAADAVTEEGQLGDSLLSAPIALIAGPSSGPRIIPSTDTTNTQQEPVVANFPRIKVKPVSQLMSTSPSNFMKAHYIPQANMLVQSQNNMPHHNDSNDVTMNMTPIPRPVNATGFQNNAQQLTQSLFEPNSDARMSMSYQNNTREVVMNSVDLPHMRTTSPFEYLKSVLQIHNIYLLCPDDIRQDSIKDFICLLKFKLVFQQESASPVALCLALFNSKDTFFVKVKGVNDVEIDLRRLSPNWQWEILKVYSGEVVTKMLANAQKVSSEVYENARKFVCYLNSIECLKNV